MADLITLSQPRSHIAEAFRTLRTNLMFMNVQKPIHTLMLTSAAQADDKSTALANLAVTFAQAGQQTILVDSDLRQPSLHTILGTGNQAGLTTMADDASALASPPLVETGVENLSLLPSGPLPDVPADFFSSQRINEIIGVLKARADYVLFDSPPVLAATDALLLGNKVDGVLLAVRAGRTRRDHTERARNALERVHVPLVGCVLLNAPRERIRGYDA